MEVLTKDYLCGQSRHNKWSCMRHLKLNCLTKAWLFTVSDGCCIRRVQDYPRWLKKRLDLRYLLVGAEILSSACTRWTMQLHFLLRQNRVLKLFCKCVYTPLSISHCLMSLHGLNWICALPSLVWTVARCDGYFMRSRKASHVAVIKW